MSRLAARIREVAEEDRLQPTRELETVPVPTLEALRGEGLFSGTLEEVSLSDFLQLLEMGMRSAEVTVWAQPGVGVLIMDQGRLVHAQVGELRGERGFFEICSWRSGEIRVRPLRTSPEPSIDTSLSFLLLEFARQMDSQERNTNRELADGGLGSEVSSVPSKADSNGQQPTAKEISQGATAERRIRELCAGLLTGSYEVVCAAIIASGEPLILGGAFAENFSPQRLTPVAKSIVGIFHRMEGETPSWQSPGQDLAASCPFPFQELELSSAEFHYVFRVLNPRPVMACLATTHRESLGMTRALLNAAVPELSALIASLRGEA